MDELTYREKWIMIINHFGLKNQVKKIAEEAYELEESILDAHGYPIPSEKKLHIAEEIADLSVLMRQVKEYFCIDENLIDDLIYQKTDRTIERIGSGYYDSKR